MFLKPSLRWVKRFYLFKMNEHLLVLLDMAFFNLVPGFKFIDCLNCPESIGNTASLPVEPENDVHFCIFPVGYKFYLFFSEFSPEFLRRKPVLKGRVRIWHLLRYKTQDCVVNIHYLAFLIGHNMPPNSVNP